MTRLHSWFAASCLAGVALGVALKPAQLEAEVSLLGGGDGGAGTQRLM